MSEATGGTRGARAARALGGRQLVVVANREPYVHRRRQGRVAVERPPGGLVAALDPVLRAVGGTWVGWGSGSADRQAVDAHDRLAVPPEAPAYTLRRVWLSGRDVAGFYNGYANQALWPLCHLLPSLARFERRFWRAYQRVNARFARAAAEECRPGALVWIQDYHFALLPAFLRQELARRGIAGARLGHFWHIPWPPWDVFRICPQRSEILRGLLANDLLGFHLPRFAENFLDCVARELDARVDRERGTVETGGHRTRVAAFPISVDFAALEAEASSPAATRAFRRLARAHGLAGRRLLLGVDRLDYTKGIPERMAAVDRFLELHPEWRGRFRMVQKVSRSRSEIPAYRRLEEEVRAEVARINARWAEEGWEPVLFLEEALPAHALPGLYRAADAALVSSLQDGMNLVSKEYVACQVDERGVLLLSELAGAAEEIEGALRINPYDVDATAEAIHRALSMPEEERRERMRAMRAFVREHDIYRWEEEFLAALEETATAEEAAAEEADWREAFALRLRERPRLALFLDYDGTLAPLVDRPEEAAMLPRAERALRRLAARPENLVAVVSGRALDDLRRRLPLPGLALIGNHGLEMAWRGGLRRHPLAEEARARVARAAALAEERLRSLPGARVEAKGLTASVHLRGVAPEAVESVRAAVEAAVRDASPAGGLVITPGKRVLEIRPDVAWDKGRAVLALLEAVAGPDWQEGWTILYAGDDVTDESAFRALAPPAFTVRVGPEEPGAPPTAARARLEGPEEMALFLEQAAAILEGTG
ncbi:MAG: bifunctional alpha,alpha-trehalose-phosphate synthase (UDP-forming)/trehalose-phosphatase [Bacillota bacterium]|nr:bifunctional alpha,alpha-trehalose-phosphate synthase (UDP-forming)/trehalose-phosphatase [Bacillota bacterium]